MTTIPPLPTDAIAWIKARVAPWTANAELLKLDPNALAELEVLVEAAAQAQRAKVAALGVYEDSVAAFDTAIDALRTLAGGQVATIRSTARNAADPQGIYSAALVPARAKRTPTPPPGTPTGFRHTLAIDGTLTVTFRCPKPPRVGAVLYRVERRLGGTGHNFLPFGTWKERKFEDATIPLGTPEVAYRVTAQTTTHDGEVAQFAVQFGAVGGPTVVERLPERSRITSRAS
ncbi:MAG: hypothetical protein KIT54_10995 [Phycisphaeraceae bacterium]|nr:hypothetical protein [Phycisphaeraceae bacterium]